MFTNKVFAIFIFSAKGEMDRPPPEVALPSHGIESVALTEAARRVVALAEVVRPVALRVSDKVTGSTR